MIGLRVGMPAAAAVLCAVAALAEPLPSAAPEEVGLSGARLAQIGEVMGAGIEAGEIPGAVVLVVRHGRVAYYEAFGWRDRASGAPMARDAIFRIYSMTKPLVSVGAMMLHEQARLYPSEPLAKYVPAFETMAVGVESFDPVTGRQGFHTEPARRAITIHDLLRHTSGLTYGFFGTSRVKDMIKEAGLDAFTLDMDLAEFSDRLAALPLAYQPGEVWDYSLSADVLGRVVEVASGLPLDQYLRERLFAPLGMVDTDFWVPPAKQDRIAEAQAGDPADGLIDVTRAPKMFAGGHGLVSTAMDYARFCQMMLARGSLEGTRILGRKTVEYMTSDHLGDISRAGTAYLPGPGYGFGLGFAVRTGAGESPWPGSVGEFFWGGYAGTYFWIDPAEQLVVVYMMQSVAQRQHYRMLLRNLVTQAIVD